MRQNATFALPFLTGALSLALAASPPALVNYQGVLRDAFDRPLSGTYDMVFRFYDTMTGGNEILVDSHTGAGGVTVTGGLFNVQLGSGTVSDGSGPGTHTSLLDVSRDHSEVWLEVQVRSEILAPRTRIVSVPFALNAAQSIDHAKRVAIKDDFLGGSNILANTDTFFTSELLYRAHVGVDVSQIYFDVYPGQNGVIEVNSDDGTPTYITTDDFPFRLDKANILFQSRFATSGGYGGSKYWSGLSDQEVLTPNNCVRFTWITFGNLFAEIRRDGSLVASVDTGVAMPNGGFHMAELRMVSATAFDVLVDGVFKGTLSATMPTVNLNYVIYAESPGNGQNAGNAVDFWALSYDRM